MVAKLPPNAMRLAVYPQYTKQQQHTGNLSSYSPQYCNNPLFFLWGEIGSPLANNQRHQ